MKLPHKELSYLTNAAQQSVHLTLGILRTSQAFLYALAFFWLDGFAVSAPAQVSPSGDDPLRGLWRKPLGSSV